MEPIRDSVILPLDEDSQVPAARRAARELAQRIGLSPEAIARAELVAVELAGNILHHAARGRLYLASTASADALQIIATDAGPGIPNPTQAIRDGFSTSTTPGFGLGAIGRLASDFDLYTQTESQTGPRPGKGTVISAIVAESRDATLHPTLAVLSTPLEGETLNGDSWVVFTSPSRNRTVYTLIDGLGHGVFACEAAGTARNITEKSLQAEPDLPLDQLLERMQNPMRATRGAAITLIAVTQNEITCCGVGNISTTLHAPNGADRTLVSSNGTLGHRIPRLQEFRYPYSPNTLLVMHSDGISTRWRMGLYPGLTERAPATIAGVLYRDSARGRDDATVLVARLGTEPYTGAAFA